MGMGDEIMAAAQAKVINIRTGKLVVIVDRLNRVRTHEVWYRNPRITSQPKNTNYVTLMNGPHVRPYIQVEGSTRFVWKPWDRVPGEIYLTDEEIEFGKRFGGNKILIEPNVKIGSSGNKSWLWDRWQRLVDMTGWSFIQVGAVGTRKLNNVEYVQTDSFRQACAVLHCCRSFVGVEGGFHHAAAAFGVPSVVLWSEFISPDITGYDTQRNIRHAGEACGSRVPCLGCLTSMSNISVDEVVVALEETL